METMTRAELVKELGMKKPQTPWPLERWLASVALVEEALWHMSRQRELSELEMALVEWAMTAKYFLQSHQSQHRNHPEGNPFLPYRQWLEELEANLADANP